MRRNVFSKRRVCAAPAGSPSAASVTEIRNRCGPLAGRESSRMRTVLVPSNSVNLEPVRVEFAADRQADVSSCSAPGRLRDPHRVKSTAATGSTGSAGVSGGQRAEIRWSVLSKRLSKTFSWSVLAEPLRISPDWRAKER